jgi:predicted transcriptional regulator YdeE
MTYTIQILPSFDIVGICVRTKNAPGAAEIDIPALWGRFFSENISSLIANRASDDIYSVYTDYETDHMGAYTTLIGHKVIGTLELTDILTKTTISAGTYYEFDSSGKQPDRLLEIWSHIWAGHYPRKYTSDFDLYEEVKSDSANTKKVKTFILTTDE